MAVEYDILAEGKTKIVQALPGTPDHVLIISKNDITAGDGAKKDLLPGKAEWSTATSVAAFRLLEMHGIPTHFVSAENDPRAFRAQLVEMIPLEVVTRRIATGSYLKRNPEVAEGTPFNPLVVEFFTKDDAMHDPYVKYDFDNSRALYYQASKPINEEGFLGEDSLDDPDDWKKTTSRLTDMATKVFETLEEAWQGHGITLVDLKIEAGWTLDGQLVVADVIDNDSWRLWPNGKKEQMLDKQVYRNLKAPPTDADLAVIAKNYAEVTRLATRFPALQYHLD